MKYSDIIETQGLVIIYQQDKPQLFIDSVEQFIEYSIEHPAYHLKNYTNIIFCDEHKNVLNENYKLSKALCIEIAKQTEYQESFIKLASQIVIQKEKVGEYAGYLDDELTHGQDLMYGLLEIGKHTYLLIERWMLALNWDQEVEQHDIPLSAPRIWGHCEEAFSLVASKLTVCAGTSASDDLNYNITPILKDESTWDVFFLATLNFKNRLIDYDHPNDTRRSFHNFHKNLIIGFDGEKAEVFFTKLVIHVTQTPEELNTYLTLHISDNFPLIEEIVHFFDQFIEIHKNDESKLKLVSYVLSILYILTNTTGCDDDTDTLEHIIKQPFPHNLTDAESIKNHYIELSNNFIYENAIKQQGLVIVYQQDKPQLFIDSVNEYIEYSNANPEYQLEYDTNIVFQDENKNILADGFEESKALCILIAKQPEFKQAFIALTTAIIKTSENKDYELSNIDCEHNHGEDLMHGLIAMGPGEHSLLIEDWMLAIDWCHEVEQDDIITSAIESWGATEESCRLAVLRISLCGGQHGGESFEHGMAKITEDESVWDLFCQSAVALSERINQLNNFRSEEYQLPPIYLWLTYDHKIEKRNILRIKLTSYLMQNNDHCEVYFKEFLSYGMPEPYNVKKDFDRWFYHAENKGFIKNTIRQLYNAHWSILNEVNCDISWEDQIEKIQSIRKNFTGISIHYADYFIKYLEYNIQQFSKKPYTTQPDHYKNWYPELSEHPHVFKPHKTEEGPDTFIIAYEPDQPGLFKLSVERLAAYLDANQKATIGSFTTLYFCNFKGEIIASRFKETKELCIKIAKQKELQETYIFLCKILMDRLINFPRHGYIDEETTHGEDLIYGLIAIGSGPHSSIIEDWMLSVDWGHDVEQFMTVSETSEWEDGIEYYKTDFLSITTCVSIAIEQSHLPSSLKDQSNLDMYCDAAMQVKYKLDNYNYRYHTFDRFTYDIKDHLHYGFFSDHVESEKWFLKVIIHITESTNELIEYFREYNRAQPSIEELIEHLDDWIAQLDATRDNILKMIKTMKHTLTRFQKELSRSTDRNTLETKFRKSRNNCPEDRPELELILDFILREF